MRLDGLLSIGLSPADRRALAGALLAYSEHPVPATRDTLCALAPQGRADEILAMGDALHADLGSRWAEKLREARDRPAATPVEGTTERRSRLDRVLASVEEDRRRELATLLLQPPSSDTDALVRSVVGGADAEWLLAFRDALERLPETEWRASLEAACAPGADGPQSMPPRAAAGTTRQRRPHPAGTRARGGNRSLGLRGHPRVAMAGVAALLVVLGTVIGFGIAPGGYAPPAMAAAWRIAGSLQQPGWFGGSTGVSEPGSATITCPGRTDCFATEPVSGPQGGSTVEATVDGGASWHMVPLPGGLDLVSGLSCPAVRTCIGLARRATPRAPVAVVTTDGGRSWSTHAIHETLARTYDVTCPTTKDCLVVGNGIATARTPTEGSSPTVLVSTDGGRSWHTSSRPKELLPAFPDAVSCVSRTTCVVTGGTTVPTAGGSMGDADIQYTVDRGRHWVHAQLPSQLGQVLAVSCTRSGLCLATAEPRPISTGTTTAFSRNIALVSHDRGHTWSRAPDQGFDVARAMTLTCTSATVCWVGGLNPSAPLDSLSATLLGTHDGGQTWSPAALPRGTGKLTLISSISCSSPAHCTGLAWSDKTTAQVVLRNSP